MKKNFGLHIFWLIIGTWTLRTIVSDMDCHIEKKKILKVCIIIFPPNDLNLVGEKV